MKNKRPSQVHDFFQGKRITSGIGDEVRQYIEELESKIQPVPEADKAIVACPKCGEAACSEPRQYDLRNWTPREQKNKPYIWFEFWCNYCGTSWGVKCELKPREIDFENID